jgi:hypothetical protein
MKFKLLSNNLTVKNITDDSYTITGPLVILNSIDLDGEQFLDSTDFALGNDGTKSTDIYYNHGLDELVGKNRIGEGIVFKADDGNVWIEAQMSLREKYEKDIFTLAKRGKLSWSSGTAPHLAQFEYVQGVKSWRTWPLGLDASLTPTPAEPKTDATVKANVKSKEDTMKKEGTKEEGTKEESQEDPNVKSSALTQFGIEFDGKIESLSKSIEKVVDRLDDLPTKSKAGFASETGGKSDETVKSFGDFLLAIKRQDKIRLATVYGSQYETTKDITVTDGVTGGYAVPTAESSNIMQAAVEASQILPLITQVPVTALSGTFPALNLSTAPTAGSGDTAEAAEVTTASRAPGGSFTETTPAFTQLVGTPKCRKSLVRIHQLHLKHSYVLFSLSQ